jgi:hypothetical protein
VYIRGAMPGRSLAACIPALLVLVADAPAPRGRATTGIERPPPLVRRPTAPGSRFEGDFRSRLRAAHPSQRFVALVDLTEQVDLKALARRLRETSASKAATRAAS